MIYNIQISSSSSGVSATELTKEEAMKILDALGGVKDLKLKMTWEPSPLPEIIKDYEIQEYPVQECRIISHPEPTLTTQEVSRFEETSRISKGKLEQYTSMGAHEMGYHDQKDGRITICYGSTKVFTTWDAIKELPYPIPKEMIKHLSTPKKKAITHFSEWIHQGMPDKYVDLDAEFRPLLNQDTGTGYDGNKVEGDLLE